jgi:hypothetical protein
MTSPPFEGHSPSSKVVSFVEMLDQCFFFFFFLGQIWPNFDHLKNMISTYTKIFHGKKKKKAQIRQISKKMFFILLPNFYDKF